jgi:patatin-related protein
MAGKAKELRLGLVCYGGSSLAIYMHGITKEINRLVGASATRAAGVEPGSPIASVYTELLDTLAKDTDLRVIVDVIAGTSAGGINGIFLGKALARNRSQDSLRDVWFDRGDMAQLTIGPQKIAGIAIPWKAKMPLLFRRALKRSPLRGDDMSRWLHEALQQMDTLPAGNGNASLLPPGHPLDLYVTITDFYGYQRLVPLSRPRFATDSRHRHAVNFHYESDGADDFTDNAGLAFAARTTSCFPAVFPPVNPTEFGKVIGDSVTPLLERCFRAYTLSGADPNDTYFIDGGVLDNKPFGWAIDAIIHDRPAQSEVDRRLLYIEPDPGGRAKMQGGDDPQTFAAAMGAMTTIPRSEPILDDLLTVGDHNDRVARIGDVIEANFDRVAALVSPIVPDELPAELPWADWSARVNTLAIANSGIGYSTYLRLKVSSVLAGFASSVSALCGYPTDSNHAALVRDAILQWGRTAGLFDGVEPTDAQVAFLRAFDLGYMRRRLRFVLAAFNRWYGELGNEGSPTREQLDRGKGILYGNVAKLDQLARPATLRDLVRETFPEDKVREFVEHHGVDGAEYARVHAVAFNRLFAQAEAYFGAELQGFAAALVTDLEPVTVGWDAAHRRELIVRYLGFPIWDVLLYPIQALTQIGEGDRIDVVRVSPHEATILPVPKEGKVEGIRVHHFYAFFSREARENDYLWGRLDAAEQLIRLLLDTSGSKEPLDVWCKKAFTAILDEEEPSLKTVSERIGSLRVAVQAL